MAERISKFELLQDYRELNEMFDRLAAFKTKYEYKRGTRIGTFSIRCLIDEIIDERYRIGQILDRMDAEEDD